MAIWTFRIFHQSIVSSTVRDIIISDGCGWWKESEKKNKLNSLITITPFFLSPDFYFEMLYIDFKGKTFVNKMGPCRGKKRQLITQNQIIISSIPWIKNTHALAECKKKERRSSSSLTWWIYYVKSRPTTTTTTTTTTVGCRTEIPTKMWTDFLQ